MKKLSVVFFSVFFAAVVLGGCKAEKKSGENVAVFVPGIISGSPVYEMLVQGVTEAVDAYNLGKAQEEKAALFVMEAGTNQAEWGSKLTALCAEGKYSVIISSNPSLPDFAVPLTEQFVNQKFILLDATFEGNPNIYTACYNQYEQAYLTGYIGALMSKTHKMALIAAQEYPVMNNILLPYFAKGGAAAFEGTTVDFLVVGNWYDANKGALLADTAIKQGADVLLPICGGASQGVINAAVNGGAYITWFDDNGFSKAPGTVISSSVMKQKEMAYIAASDYFLGKTEWGKAQMVGIKEGFVDFVQDDALYIQTVPKDVRDKMSGLVSKIKGGELVIE